MIGPHHCIGDCTRAENRIRDLTSALEEANYRAAHYQREACQLVDSDRADTLQQHFGLNVEESIVCAALYQRRDRWLSGSNLEGLLDDCRGGSTEASLVSQMVVRIRRKLGDTAVENSRGRGYRLSAATLKRLDRKLSRATGLAK